jgi:colicin import membrane protein
MSTASAALFDERIDPGKVSSALLAAAVHLALLAVLVFGVRWQSRPPEAVSVELWEPPAPVAEAPAPAPKIEPPPAPAAKPEPVIEKPDIALKAPPPKPAPKAELKETPKPEVVKPKADEARKRMQQELAREQNSLAVDRERQQFKDQLTREATSIESRALEAWKAKIVAKIKRNIIPPPDLQGNPETIFIVIQIPSGDVISRKLEKSSGNKAYDEAVERAILKASPLPPPDRPELFDRGRELTLKFRPKD